MKNFVIPALRQAQDKPGSARAGIQIGRPVPDPGLRRDDEFLAASAPLANSAPMLPRASAQLPARIFVATCQKHHRGFSAKPLADQIHASRVEGADRPNLRSAFDEAFQPVEGDGSTSVQLAEKDFETLQAFALRIQSNVGADPLTGADLGAGPGAGTTSNDVAR